jgi:hypothetical protein
MVLAVTRNDCKRGAVKGSCSNVANAGFKESPTKFISGLAREGHRENLIGRYLALEDSSLNSQGQDVSFSRSGGGADHETPGVAIDGFALFGRQPYEHLFRKSFVTHGA